MQMMWNSEYPNKTGYYYGRAGNTNTSARVERAPHADKCPTKTTAPSAATTKHPARATNSKNNELECNPKVA